MNEDMLMIGAIILMVGGFAGIWSYDVMNLFGIISSAIGFIVGSFLVVLGAIEW